MFCDFFIASSRGKPIELPMRRDIPAQEIFFYNAADALEGRSYDACENIIALTTQLHHGLLATRGGVPVGARLHQLDQNASGDDSLAVGAECTQRSRFASANSTRGMPNP